MLKRITLAHVVILVLVGIAVFSKYHEPKAVQGFGTKDNIVPTFHVTSKATKM